MSNKHRYQTLPVLALLLFLLLSYGARSPDQTAGLTIVEYNPTDEIFLNPERGFYRWTEGVPGGNPLNVSTLRGYRDEGFSLLIRLYYIAEFRDSDFSQAFIDQMGADFEAMRQAGVKSIIRFRYTKSMNDPDAPLERVLAHLEQLRPVLERNYDVIAVANAGFIGAWGEWHASSNNLTTVENMRTILFKFLDVMPDGRSIQVRYPQAKMQVFETHSPISPEMAYGGSNFARTGHHNDCFLASPSDVGTYRIGATWEKNFLNQDNRYLPMGGETCNPRPDAGDRYHCETALHELDFLHWSFLNWNYSRQILDTWEEQGCMPEVKRRLGYRFAMHEGQYSEEVRQGAALKFRLQLENQGFAAPFNPRGLQVILRDLLDPEQVWEVNLPDDPRLWLGGDTVTLDYQLGIPHNLADGLYEMHLNMPDPTDRLRHVPEYSIRMANQGVWESATGFNSLGHIVNIDSDASAEDYDGDLIFQEFGTWVSSRDEQMPVEYPEGIRLNHNYPNPFNPVTQLSFELEEAIPVRLDVFDLLGQHVATLVDEHRSAGLHMVSFDASNLSSGTYLYRLTAGDKQITRSMMLLK